MKETFWNLKFKVLLTALFAVFTQLAQAESAPNTVVPPASQIEDASGGIWTITSARTILRNGSPAGYSANVTMLVYKDRRIYQQNTAGGWWYWDGQTWIRTSDPRSSLGQSPDGTTIPSSTFIVDSSGGVWTLTPGRTIHRNDQPAGYSANVTLLVYKGGRVYQQNSAGGWWYWDGNTWIRTSDPRTPSAPTPSPDGTTVPGASQIVDSNNAVWTIAGDRTILRNGTAAGYSANVTLLIYKGGRVYQQNEAGGFWYWDGSTWIGSSDPRGGGNQPPPNGGGSITMPMVPNPIPPDSISMTCTDAARQFRGSFFVENNKWGAALGIFGGPNYQCAGIGGLAADGSVSAKWVWNYGEGNSEVKGYPSISYGQRPGYEKTAGSVLPKVVNDLSYAQVAWNGTSAANGKGHNAFDIWLTTDGVNRGIFFNNNITHEIMISTNNWGTYGDFPNPAWLYENEVTIDGIRYRVTKADNFPPGGVGGRTWRFVVFKMLEDRPVGSLNLMSFMQYLKNRGLITGREYMNSIEYGTEQEVGSGEVKIHGYKLDVR